MDTFISQFFMPFCVSWNASTETIYNGCRTNAAAEAPYDRARFLAL